MKPLLLLDCYLTGSGWQTFRPFLEGTRPVEVVRPSDEAPPRGAEAFGAIVVTGSAASVVEPEPWNPAATSLLRDAVERGVPVLGVCFGHQLLATALWGPSACRVAPHLEVGWEQVEVVAPDPLLEPLGPRFRTFVSHRDEVLPQPGMHVLARSARCPVQAYRVAGRPLWGVQFHTEMSIAEASEVVRKRAALFPEEVDAQALLPAAIDGAPLARALFGRFLAIVAALGSHRAGGGAYEAAAMQVQGRGHDVKPDRRRSVDFE